MDNEFIQIKNLNYSFEEVQVLKDINFSIKRGEIAAIIGPNGSGKTTLLKNIIGLYKPSSGTILIDGLAPKKVLKRIAYIPQRFDFDRSVPITVYEFMSLERCNKKNHSCSNIPKRLEDLGLKSFEKRKLGELSGGQFQRLMIARVLLHEKELLILDEPSTGIDLSGGETIYDLIKQLNSKNKTTCLMVSHELNIVNKYADKVICLNKELLCLGKPLDLINSENLSKLYGANSALYNHKHL